MAFALRFGQVIRQLFDHFTPACAEGINRVKVRPMVRNVRL